MAEIIGAFVDGAEAGESKTFDFVLTWQVDDVFEYLDIVEQGPSKDSVFTYDGFHGTAQQPDAKRRIGPAWVVSCSYTRLGKPMPNGRLQFQQKLKLQFVSDKTTELDLAPWMYPIKDWTIGSATESVQLRGIWNVNDEWQPFQNSSGEMLDGSFDKGVMTISFSYNLPPNYLDENAAWQLVGTVNQGVTAMNGRTFPARTLLLNNINIMQESMTPATNSTSQSVSANMMREIEYQKISLQFMFKPETHNNDYLNVGTMLWTWNLGEDKKERVWRQQQMTPRYNEYGFLVGYDFIPAGWSWEAGTVRIPNSGQPTKIWSWIGQTGEQIYGTRAQYDEEYRAGKTYMCADNGREVTEPMFLNDSDEFHETIMPFDQSTGRQMESYITGCPYRIADWSGLYIPKKQGWRHFSSGEYVY